MCDQLFKPNMILAIDSETTGLVRAVNEAEVLLPHELIHRLIASVLLEILSGEKLLPSHLCQTIVDKKRTK